MPIDCYKRWGILHYMFHGLTYIAKNYNLVQPVKDVKDNQLFQLRIPVSKIQFAYRLLNLTDEIISSSEVKSSLLIKYDSYWFLYNLPTMNHTPNKTGIVVLSFDIQAFHMILIS